MAERPLRYWLFKSEPSVFSFDHLLQAPQRRTRWDGVRNYKARNLLRDEVKLGDRVLFYHSSADPPGVAGIAEVVREAYPDPTQFDPKDPHYDAESDRENPRWYVVDVAAVARLPEFVSLPLLRANKALSGMSLLQRGNRLSIQPVSALEWKIVLEEGGLDRV
jgi:predicted RNA-binding protein with PUA-like domain